MTEEDDILMARIRRRDAAAFEALAARYREALHAHLARILRSSHAADDLLQEVLLRAWMRADQWDGRGTVRAWLFGIATHLALNHQRTLRRRREEGLSAEAADTLPALGPEQQAEEAQERERLRRLVAALPADKRAVFELVYDAELDHREIAERLGIPEGTVKSRLHHARKRLAQAWREEVPDWEDW